MKFLRNTLDRIEPLFHKGGKLERLFPLYEALDTFLYTPGEVSKGASHVRDGMDLKRMMIMVVFALTPCILMACYNTGALTNEAAQAAVESGVSQDDVIAQLGWRAPLMMQAGWDPGSGGDLLFNFLHGALYFLPVFLVTNIVGGAWEVIFSCVRKHDLNEGFLVTGMLFPLTLPATIPLWQVALGISFGVVIGKEIFGGTGKNFLNPALTARTFLYFAYPIQITGSTVWAGLVDGVSCPTLLTTMSNIQNALPNGESFTNVLQDQLGHLNLSQAFLGFIPGSMGETSTLACLLGAIFLIVTGVGSWRIMLGVLIGSMGLATLLNGVESTSNAMYQIPPLWHLCTGGLAFGLVFMATDPVSAAMTDTGRWVYGILVGMMAITVRVLNPAFPEGIMLAILLGNVFAPVIDFVVVQQNIKRRIARNES
ncbi:MAG: NADH:ubiquinone reductase (Na(+)-transporting) subunit B [Fuerstiella sp.]|nr:NADH:ubiquinone reductase (Na(+)-transporting) subunit B [Fuerstiella sp.]MCP4859328.1 NADH:ubiquinone reductase (Na(+)-transporting) subunit B [Fuerstiella sp.]